MEIKTRFNTDEAVYLILNNEIVRKVITNILISYAHGYKPLIRYKINGDYFEEEKLYKTKEELIEYINSL